MKRSRETFEEVRCAVLDAMEEIGRGLGSAKQALEDSGMPAESQSWGEASLSFFRASDALSDLEKICTQARDES